MAEARRVEKTYTQDNSHTPANENRPPLRVLRGGKTVSDDSTRNASIQTTSTNADRNTRKTATTYKSQQDIASRFNESYSKQGLQPRGLVGNEAGEASPRPPYQQPDQITRSAETTNQQRGLVKRGTRTLPFRKRLKKRSIAKRAFAKVRVTAVNTWVWGWGFWSWLMFQLPFAIACVVFMGLTQYVSDLLTKAEENPSLLQIIKDNVIKGVVTAAKWVSDIVGFNIEMIAPANFFMLTYIIVLMFGWFTLFLIYFQYKIAFIRPIGGRGSGIKTGMLLLAVVGYAIPIANLVPWFIFWTMAVWWYPK